MRYIVVDIDGTLSVVGDRLKYITQEPKDWDKFYNDCFDDEPIPDIIKLVQDLSDRHNIIYCTGRRESVRTITDTWLAKHQLPLGPIIMRGNDDTRHDTVTKPFNLMCYLTQNKIHGHKIWFILEDRQSMVDKWRELGFTCLQTARGDF